MYNYHCYNDFLYFKINKEKLERTIKIFNKWKERACSKNYRIERRS